MTNFHKRLEKLRIQMGNKNLDCLYITKTTNVKYMTGFTGSAGQFILTEKDAIFLTDSRYTEQSQKQVTNAQIHIIEKGYVALIKKLNVFKNGMKVGFESIHTSVKLYNDINKEFEQIKFIPTEELVEDLAAVKDMDEINSLKAAIEITDSVFDEILPEMKEGAVEKNIAAKISYLFKLNGAEGDSFDTIIASGIYSALPHASPSDKAFEKGDFVVMDFGAKFEGYHADMTRTVVVGEATDRHREIYDIVRGSNLAGIDAAKAGVTGAFVDAACREYIDKRGYGDKFIHSTGHGIGLEVHTSPRLYKENNTPLEENNVVTIEPGIYIPDFGGVRIEDDIWIQSDGCTPLNRSTKDLIVV